MSGNCSQKTEIYCSETVHCLEFDDRYLVAGADQMLLLYNVCETDEEYGLIGSYVGHDGSVTCLQFDSQKLGIMGLSTYVFDK
jgi:hypothetical protein